MRISFRERDPVKIGIVSMVAIGALLAVSFSLNRLPFIAGDYQLRAEFTDAAGLAAGNEVRVAGLKVGTVREVELRPDRVLVTMRIDDEVSVPHDATAEISLSTILGTKFVGLDVRSDAEPLPEGATILLEQTKVPFEIYQLTNRTVDLLEKVDSAKLDAGLRALGEIADDPERNIANALEGASDVSAAIASQSEALGSLIDRSGDLLETLDSSSADIQRIIDNSAVILDVISKRRGVVKALLRNTDLLASSLGGLLRDDRRQIDSILKDLHSTLVIVDRNLAEVEQAIKLLGPSSESLARILWTGPWANICVFSIDWINGERQGIGTGDPAGPNGPVECDPSP